MICKPGFSEICYEIHSVSFYIMFLFVVTCCQLQSNYKTKILKCNDNYWIIRLMCSKTRTYSMARRNLKFILGKDYTNCMKNKGVLIPNGEHCKQNILPAINKPIWDQPAQANPGRHIPSQGDKDNNFHRRRKVSVWVSLCGMLILIRVDTLRRVHNVGFHAERLIC